MATYDQTGKPVEIVDDSGALPEVTVSAARPVVRDWSGLAFALLAAVAVLMLDEPEKRRKRRAR